MSKIEELMEEVSDKIGAKRVYAEPYEKDGLTVIAAAALTGGAGGGSGQKLRIRQSWGTYPRSVAGTRRPEFAIGLPALG